LKVIRYSLENLPIEKLSLFNVENIVTDLQFMFIAIIKPVVNFILCLIPIPRIKKVILTESINRF